MIDNEMKDAVDSALVFSQDLARTGTRIRNWGKAEALPFEVQQGGASLGRFLTLVAAVACAKKAMR